VLHGDLVEPVAWTWGLSLIVLTIAIHAIGVVVLAAYRPVVRQERVFARLVQLTVASVLALSLGCRPVDLYRLLIAGTWGNAYGIGQVLFKATPLIFADGGMPVRAP
jgi:ABC-type uncharacterized transport system permease subunit